MKIKDITRLREETDVKIEPSPDLAKATGPDGQVIATGPTAALQAATDAGVDFTPGEVTETGQSMTMPTTEYVKGIYAAAAENGMDAPEVEAVKKQMVLAPNGEVDIMATMQKAVQVFQSPEWKQMLADLDALVKRAESSTHENHGDVGGDGTGAFIYAVRDADAETAMGYGPQDGEEPLDEFLGFGNKSPEEWAKTSTQMAKLLQFRAKAVGTPYADQVEKRIKLLKDRLDMDAGEVAGPGGMPKDPVPPEQFNMKQLREADNALLEKMRAIAGLR
jgi:hypothetical protein